MSESIYFDDDLREQFLFAFKKARADRESYLNWLKDEISKAVQLINRYDKLYVLGGLGARLLQASPNIFNQFMASYDGPDKEDAKEDLIIDDEEIEVLLEYALSLATASLNSNVGIIPTIENIDEIRLQLAKIKFNIGFYELSADSPGSTTEFDHWLKIRVMDDALNIRGDGYHSHIVEIYKETFAPHDDFLNQFYGFNSNDILETINRFDLLVTSKMGNAFGATSSHRRFIEWNKEKGSEAIMEEMMATGRPFIQQFVEENPDLLGDTDPMHVCSYPLDNVEGYKKLFWIIPNSDKQKKIFELLSHQFGENTAFTQGKFGGFPLGDTLSQTKPLVKIDDKYYCFSVNIAFRNIFNIAANLLQSADPVYYEHSFKGNANYNTRDNYIERKTKELFEKMLPDVRFYHSLKYDIVEDGLDKNPELDIIGISNETIYIIEVKAGELNKKHKRGAILGLKDRLKETINEGSYQCYRAEKHINESDNPVFSYVEEADRHSLIIDKSKPFTIHKISVTFEHFSTVSVNLKYLIESGVMSIAYKWTWIVSLYDLMVFADLIENEIDFKDYLQHRLNLYERNDVEFKDELDILGFFLKGKFPLGPEKEKEIQFMVSFKDDIDEYYTKKDLGMLESIKPTRNRN
jgi:hypothetical protein